MRGPAVALALIAALIVGCGESGEDASSAMSTTSTTVTTSTTTVPATPRETYEEHLRARIDIDARPGSTGDGYADLMDLGQQACDLMTSAVNATDESGASGTPDSDALQSEVAAALEIAQTALGDDRIVAVFLRTTTSDLCPQHEASVKAQLDTLGQ